MKREQITVIRRREYEWTVRHGAFVVAIYTTQRQAIAGAREAVHDHLLMGGKVQIIIHKADGAIQRDVTLPRSSDPRCSRG